MSSIYVRNQIKNFLALEASTENVVDLTAQFGTVQEFLEEAGVLPDEPWLAVEFIGDDEQPITVPATNTTGKYRETGGVYFHVVTLAKIGVGDSLLTRGEALRNLLRGQRLGRLVVESVTPLVFGDGASLQFEVSYISGSFLISYYCDTDL